MIIGNLGRDPELRYLPSGKPVTNFSVAVSRRFKGSDGEQREETEWFNVVMFDKLADIANQYITKGQKVYIEGRLRSHSWEDQQGQKHNRTEIYANDMVMLSPGRGVRQESGGEHFDAEPEIQAGEQDLPF
jgi:single-strand DNA-binding protein